MHQALRKRGRERENQLLREAVDQWENHNIDVANAEAGKYYSSPIVKEIVLEACEQLKIQPDEEKRAAELIMYHQGWTQLKKIGKSNHITSVADLGVLRADIHEDKFRGYLEACWREKMQNLK